MSILLETRADGLNEHELGQPRRHRLGSRTVGIKFLRNFRSGRLKPRRGARRLLLEMEERRENGPPGIGCSIRKSQAATNQTCDGSIGSRPKLLSRGWVVVIGKIGGPRFHRVTDDVGIAPPQYDL